MEQFNKLHLPGNLQITANHAQKTLCMSVFFIFKNSLQCERISIQHHTSHKIAIVSISRISPVNLVYGPWPGSNNNIVWHLSRERS